MSDHPRIPYADALAIAQELMASITPACVRIEIAGSLRRKCETVADVDVVAIPRLEQATDLFGEPIGQPASRLDASLASLDAKWLIMRWHKNGPALKSFDYRAATVELSIVRPETWGIMFMIKTGGEEFSHWMVTAQEAHGALPFGIQVKDGRLWKMGRPIDTPEEIDVFNAIGLPYIPPEQRSGHGWFRQGYFVMKQAE